MSGVRMSMVWLCHKVLGEVPWSSSGELQNTEDLWSLVPVCPQILMVVDIACYTPICIYTLNVAMGKPLHIYPNDHAIRIVIQFISIFYQT